MLQLIIALRTYCTNRENNGNSLKLYLLKMINEIRAKYEKIFKKYKDLDKDNKQSKGNGNQNERKSGKN